MLTANEAQGITLESRKEAQRKREEAQRSAYTVARQGVEEILDTLLASVEHEIVDAARNGHDYGAISLPKEFSELERVAAADIIRETLNPLGYTVRGPEKHDPRRTLAIWWA